MPQAKTIIQLFEIGAIKFGSFKLKTGITSPIYLDLRLVVSYPALLKQIAQEMGDLIKGIEKNCICGVPYTALPIATAISLSYGIPMVMRRKEVKDYGTKQAIEGTFQRNDRCVVIEDLVTSGTSVFETIAPLEQEGLVVKDVIVLIDREQGGKQNLAEQGYRLHSVTTLSEILSTLSEGNHITVETKDQVLSYLKTNQTATMRT